VRFSLAVSTKGTPDTSRNVRGFATKFYTEEGIFDLICNHIPVFSVRDTIRFP
ncbi:catalase, partial [Mycobacterium tuberculosis]|nr:catalase [Mycobacterium tuberculosis]